jgi:acetyl esterase/lipase
MTALARPHALLAAALLSLSATAGVARPTEAAPTQADAPTTGRFIEPVFDDVDVTQDIPYRRAINARGDLQTLHMDIYEPAGDTAERRPVVVLIHGGYFTMGNNQDDQWGAGPFVAELFARLGYVTVSIEYRLRPDTLTYPDPDLRELEAANLDAHDDAVAAIAWLHDRAAELRIDPQAIVADGPSAGGFVAWNLAWMHGSTARPAPSGVAAAISIAGAPFEVSETTGEPLAAASPGDPPVLAIHGTADDVVPFELAQGPCSRAAEAGVRCDLVPLQDIGHPGIDPRFVDQHLATIERRTIEFLAEVVLEPLGYLDEHPSDRPAAPDQPDEAELSDAPEPPRPAQAPPATPVTAHPAFTG